MDALAFSCSCVFMIRSFGLLWMSNSWKLAHINAGTQDNGSATAYNGNGALQKVSQQGTGLQEVDTSLPMSDEAYPERIPFHQCVHLRHL